MLAHADRGVSPFRRCLIATVTLVTLCSILLPCLQSEAMGTDFLGTAEADADQSAQASSEETSSADHWKGLRDWAALGLALLGSLLSVYLFFENRALKARATRVEANEAVTKAWKLLLGGEGAIYSPSRNPVALEEASRLVEGALTLDPKNPLAMRYKSIVCLAQGRIEEAIRLAEAVVEQQPDGFEAHLALGNAFSEAGRDVEALESFSRASELAPNDSLPYSNRADLLRRLERLDEAVPLYKKAIELSAKDYRSYNNLGFSLFCQGKIEEAVEVFFRAIAENPDQGLLYFNLGNLLASQDRSEEALDAYSRSLELDPRYLLGNVNLLPTTSGELQLARNSEGRWQITVASGKTVSIPAEDLKAQPYSEPGSLKSAARWQLIDERE